MSILAARGKERLAAHSISEQLAAVREQLAQAGYSENVDHVNVERRKTTKYVMHERRGLNPQRRGFEDQSDIEVAFIADSFIDNG